VQLAGLFVAGGGLIGAKLGGWYNLSELYWVWMPFCLVGAVMIATWNIGTYFPKESRYACYAKTLVFSPRPSSHERED
jgi:hypothetical protein